jgi:O-antigen ligase
MSTSNAAGSWQASTAWAEPRLFPLLAVTYYAFVFSIVFDIPEKGIPVELHTIAGCAFLLASFFQPDICYRRIPQAALWFGLYWGVYLIQTIGSEHLGEALKRCATFPLLVVLFCASYNLMQAEQVARNTLVAILLSCFVLACLQHSGLANLVGSSEAGRYGERDTVLGQNPNFLALHMVLGIVAAIALRANKAAPLAVPGLVLLVMIALMATSVIRSESRAAIIALAVGLVTLQLDKETGSSRLRTGLVAVAALAFVIVSAFLSDTMRARLEASMEAGDMAKREFIYPAARDMILERPFLGWGPADNNYQLAARVPRTDLPTRETHNVVLEVLSETGIVGALPFLIAVGLCLRGAWIGRHGPLGIPWLALTAAVLVGKMASAGIYLKMHWLVLAAALASGDRFIRHSRENSQAPM